MLWEFLLILIDATNSFEQLTSSNQDRYENRPTQFVNNHIISFDNILFFNENTLKLGLAHSK